LADGVGSPGTKPTFEENRIMFNGVEDDSHESAYVNKNGSEFGFCKTARKPYDSVVVAFYKLIRKYTGAVLSSDGGDGVFYPDSDEDMDAHMHAMINERRDKKS